MRFIFAFLFLAVAVVALVAYNGTPHGGPTVACGPITFFSHTYTVHADCRYVSIGEIVAGIAFFLFALITLLAARPRS